MQRESKAAQKRREETDATNMLRWYLKPGSVVYATVRKVSCSGMTRRIDLYTIVTYDDDNRDGGRPWLAYLSRLAAAALGLPVNDDGIRVDGCGMDMRHDVVEALSFALFGFERKPEGGYVVEQLRMEAF
jgi:hypothetical protein